MNKIRYILDLSNMTATDEAADALRRAAADADLKRKKRRAVRKAVLIAAAVIAVAAAVTAAVFAVSRASKQPDTRDRVTIYYISQESHYHELFLFTAAHTRITGQGEVIMSQRYYSDYAQYFGTTDAGILPSLYYGAYRFIPCETEMASARAEVRAAKSELLNLPDGVQTIIIGISTHGSYEYFLTLDVVPVQTGQNDNGPVYDMYSPDGELIGQSTNSRRLLNKPCLTFTPGYDYLSGARVYKTRMEYGTYVIYGVYNAADAASASVSFDGNGEPVFTVIPEDGSVVFRTHDTIVFNKYDPYRSSYEIYPACYDVTFTSDHFGWDKTVLGRICEQLDLQWFMPMFEFETADGGVVIVGDALRLSEPQPLADSMGQLLSRYGSDGSFAYNYDYYDECDPRFAEDFCDIDTFTAVYFENGSLADVLTVTLDELEKMLENSGRDTLPYGAYTASYPVFKYEHFEGGVYMYPFSLGRLSLLTEKLPDRYCTLFERLGMNTPDPERVIVLRDYYAVFDSHEEPQLITIDPISFHYKADGRTITVTGEPETTVLTGADGTVYTVTAVPGHRRIGNYVCDLDGRIFGLATKSGLIPFDHCGTREDELFIVSDSDGTVLYVTTDEIVPEYGRYPFETLVGAVSFDTLSAVYAFSDYGYISKITEAEDGVWEFTYNSPYVFYPYMTYPIRIDNTAAVCTDTTSGVRFMRMKNGRIIKITDTDDHAYGLSETLRFEYDKETRVMHVKY